MADILGRKTVQLVPLAKKNATPNKSLAFLLAFPVLFQPLDLMDLGMFPTALHLYSNTLKV